MCKDQFFSLEESEKYDVLLTAETIYEQEYHTRLYQLMKTIIKKGGSAYVAAKGYYFGCSGSLSQFLDLVRRDQHCEIETVFQNSQTVRREIVRLRF